MKPGDKWSRATKSVDLRLGQCSYSEVEDSGTGFMPFKKNRVLGFGYIPIANYKHPDFSS